MHIYIIYIYIYTYFKDFKFWWVEWSCIQRFWKQGPSQVFIKNLKHRIHRNCSERMLMSLNGVLLFLTSNWMFVTLQFRWNILQAFLYKQHLQATPDWNWQKVKQKLSNAQRLNVWQKYPNKQVFLFCWGYMINCH